MKTSFSNRNRLTAGILLVILASLCVASTAPPPARADGGVRQDGQEKKKEDFTDEDLKVEKIPGKWRLGSLVDTKQGFDPSVPVVVAAFKTVYGQGKYLGRIKIPALKIENRSQKVLESVQLRWAIVNNNDRDTILLEGVTPFIQARIEPFNPPLLIENIEPIYFNKIVKPLLKDGELNFHVLLIVGIQQARFADGTAWQRNKQAAFLKTSLSGLRFDLRPAHFQPMLFLNMSTWRRPWSRPSTTSPCEEQPRSLASAVLFVPLQIIDPPCRENMRCDYDQVANKNICVAEPGIFCDRGDCDEEGHCACWQALGPCPTCPDNDGDGHTAQWCGGADCNDNDDSIRPGAPDFCGDGITTVTNLRTARNRHVLTTAPTTTGTTTAKSKATVTTATSMSTPGRPKSATTELIMTAPTATPRACRVT